ncbi:uncharacterized protein LOC111263217 isoform X2 [Varroa jacobsoni]|uniref:uncharacterized protein LOC111263217 isoform X2 n=1 Tax=Varroa jacobsoni TaxID=62625 RepID=UPI000BF38C55|nr:uncharacterized protein LOC111263217 isoform X2 [Varroa jacobsoni]
MTNLSLPEACRGPPFLFESVIFPDMDSACVVLYDSPLQQFYPGVKMEHLKCTYKEVLRDTNHDIIDSYFKLKSAEDLSLPIACVQAEFIWISCKIAFNNKTTKTFTQPVMIPKVKPLKVQRNREWSTSINSSSKGKAQFNVIVLGIDAMSRLSLYRTMPQTVKWLHSRPNSVVELKGYSKVGLNSAPNIFALLTGRNFIADLKPQLAGYSRYVDGITRFIWEDAADAGYRTMFLEEQGEYGIFVFPDFKGFKEVPVDYWPKPFMYSVNKKAKDMGFSYHCIGPKLKSNLYLDYTYSMLKLHGPQRPMWAFTWLSILSHGGAKGGVPLDQPVSDFFTKIENEGILNRSVIIFLADHGFRHGSFRETEQGRLEDSLPFGFVLLPPSLVKQYPYMLTQLQLNSRRLVTSYDLYEVLRDAINISHLQSNHVKSHSKSGISLIRDSVPITRTCGQAWIPNEYCPCSKRELYNNTKLAHIIGNKGIIFLNGMLKNASVDTVSNDTHVCSPWSLLNVTKLTYSSMPNHLEFLFQVNMIAKPQAKFDITVTITRSSWILNEVTRIDRYGELAACATGRIQQYCYCIEKPDNSGNTSTPD